MNRKLRDPSILEANYYYLFIAIAMIILGQLNLNWSFNEAVLISQYGLFLLPALLYIKIRGYSLKKVLRLNRLSIKQVFLIPLITIFAYPIGLFFNYIMIIVLSVFDKVQPNPIPIPETGGALAIGLLLIALTPGICEEVLFRGLMLKSYEKLGKRRSILITGILFGVFHFSLQNLFGPMFLGILFGYILYKTNSIFSTMLAHATNNATAILIGFGAKKLTTILGETVDLSRQGSMDALEQMSSMSVGLRVLTYIPGLIFVGGAALVGGTIVYFLLKVLPDGENKTDDVLYLKEKEVGISGIDNGLSGSKKFIAILPLILAGIIFIYEGYLFITL